MEHNLNWRYCCSAGEAVVPVANRVLQCWQSAEMNGNLELLQDMEDGNNYYVE